MSNVKVRLENLLNMPQSVTACGTSLTLEPKGRPRSVLDTYVPDRMIKILKQLKIKVTVVEEQVEQKPPVKEEVVKEKATPKTEVVKPEPTVEDPAQTYSQEIESLMTLKKARLIELCEERELDFSGNKVDLSFRLAEVLTTDQIEELVKESAE